MSSEDYEKRKEYYKQYRESQARKDSLKKYNCSDKRKAVNKKYRDSHKQLCLEQSIRWQVENRDRVNELTRLRNATERGKALRRAREKRYAEKCRIKRLAKDAVHNAVKAGRIVRPEECSVCGSSDRIQGHHGDYSKPLEVDWLCHDCHIVAHYGFIRR